MPSKEVPQSLNRWGRLCGAFLGRKGERILKNG